MQVDNSLPSNWNAYTSCIGKEIHSSLGDEAASMGRNSTVPKPRTLYTTIESFFHPVPDVPHCRSVNHNRPFITATKQQRNFDDYATLQKSSFRTSHEDRLGKTMRTIHHSESLGRRSNVDPFSGYIGCIAPSQRKVRFSITDFTSDIVEIDDYSISFCSI